MGAPLYRTARATTDASDQFYALTAATETARFIDDLSNWYVRRSRARFWDSSDTAAYDTLYRCLVTGARLLAPFTPYLADEVYVRLTGELSVHASDWPTAAGAPDERLASEMAAARQLVGLGRAARTEAKVRTRQPLKRALLVHPSNVTLGSEVRNEIRDELNVKELQDVESLAELVSWTAVPNFRTLGPRLGPRVNEIKQVLAEADGSARKAELAEHGSGEGAGERLAGGGLGFRGARRDAVRIACAPAQAFLALAVFAVDCLPVDFLALDFFAVDFLPVDFLAVDFLAVDFLAVDFLAAAFFFAGAFLAGAGSTPNSWSMRLSTVARAGPRS